MCVHFFKKEAASLVQTVFILVHSNIRGKQKGSVRREPWRTEKFRDGRRRETPKKDKEQSKRIRGTTRKERGCH